ncbi:MAG: Gfo/Idh/MocA family oxidoreductase [Spirochaetales bacterium]|nr:Gfo/Idh/MocA family oxidoreductase [Spirochaetales bacterium]
MKINWGIIGDARIARNFVIPGMQAGKYSKIVAIASRNILKAEKTADNMGIEKAYGSYEDLLADKSIDAVYIPLPNHLHVEWSIKAMEAGKHVLCEKPFALSIDDVGKAIKVRDRTGKKISEAFMVRSNLQWLKAKELIKKDEFGKLRAVQGFFSYNNTDPDNIRNSAEMGGGGIWDIGCYPVNTSRFIFDEEPLRVVSSIEYDPVFKVDRLASVLMEYPGGQAQFISSTQITPFQRMLFVGTKEHLEVEIPFNAPDKVSARIFISDNFTRAEERELIELPVCNQYTLQGDAFSKAIIENTEVPVTLEDTLKNSAVLLAIFRSAQTGRWENVSI